MRWVVVILFSTVKFFFLRRLHSAECRKQTNLEEKKELRKKVKRLNENRNKRDVKKYSTHKWPMPFIRYTEIKRVLKQQQNEKQQQQHNIHSTTSMLLHSLYISSVRYLEVMAEKWKEVSKRLTAKIKQRIFVDSTSPTFNCQLLGLRWRERRRRKKLANIDKITHTKRINFSSQSQCQHHNHFY